MLAGAWIKTAFRSCARGTTYAIEFFPGQQASTPAAKHSIVYLVRHLFLLLIFWQNAERRHFAAPPALVL